jgi:hypothetical protein
VVDQLREDTFPLGIWDLPFLVGIGILEPVFFPLNDPLIPLLTLSAEIMFLLFFPSVVFSRLLNAFFFDAVPCSCPGNQ